MRIELRTPLSSDDLLKYAEAFPLIKTNHIFTHITTDSREAKEGDLFFSLSKSKESAEIHIAEAHKIGAFSVSSLSKTASYLVKDAQTALLKLALLHKSRLKRRDAENCLCARNWARPATSPFRQGWNIAGVYAV